MELPRPCQMLSSPFLFTGDWRSTRLLTNPARCGLAAAASFGKST